MADETVSGTPAMYPGCTIRDLPASEDIDAGELVNIVSQEFALAQAADAVALTDLKGVCVLGGVTGMSPVVVTKGPIDPGFTVTPGVTYYASKNAGKITKAIADISGAGASILGYGISASKLQVDPKELSTLA